VPSRVERIFPLSSREKSDTLKRTLSPPYFPLVLHRRSLVHQQSKWSPPFFFPRCARSSSSVRTKVGSFPLQPAFPPFPLRDSINPPLEEKAFFPFRQDTVANPSFFFCRLFLLRVQGGCLPFSMLKLLSSRCSLPSPCSILWEKLSFPFGKKSSFFRAHLADLSACPPHPTFRKVEHQLAVVDFFFSSLSSAPVPLSSDVRGKVHFFFSSC